jgi:hypothetical protein
VDKKVEGRQIGKLEPLHLSDPQRSEKTLDPLGTKLPCEKRIPSVASRNDTNVDEVTLVTRTTVRQKKKPQRHTSNTSTRGDTASRGTVPLQIARTCDAFGRGPA